MTDVRDDAHITDPAIAGPHEGQPLTDAEQADAGEIRAEIDETREEMGGTLNELGDRLDPAHLVNQAKENVRDATIGRVEETAKGMTDMVMDTIKKNPIPAAIAGAGLALLWANRSSGTAGGYGAGRIQQPSGVTDTAKDAIGSAASSVGSAVGSVGENASQAAGDVLGRGRETAGELGFRLERFMHASPIAMGAIAAGAGAVLGALVPGTPAEKQVMGDASRQVGETVRDTVGEATDKAEETVDRVGETVATS